MRLPCCCCSTPCPHPSPLPLLYASQCFLTPHMHHLCLDLHFRHAATTLYCHPPCLSLSSMSLCLFAAEEEDVNSMFGTPQSVSAQTAPEGASTGNAATDSPFASGKPSCYSHQTGHQPFRQGSAQPSFRLIRDSTLADMLSDNWCKPFGACWGLQPVLGTLL